MKYHRHVLAGTFMSVFSVMSHAADTPEDKDLSAFLVDISPGPVSAGAMVGLSGGAITEIQSFKDLVLAVKPLASGNSKTGYGFAITPARTAIRPLAMRGSLYKNGAFIWKLLGTGTISYAENTSDLAGTLYRKRAFSLDTNWYLHPDQDDPIILGASAFHDCGELRRKKEEEILREEKNAQDSTLSLEQRAQAQKASESLQAEAETLSTPDQCANMAKYETRWNASKFSVSYGQGWARTDSGAGPTYRIGHKITLGAILDAGTDRAVYLSVQRTTRELDFNSLPGTPLYKSSSLVAARFTQGSQGLLGNLRLLAEVSNAKSGTGTESNTAFKYALGLDKQIMQGLWLELRVGRKPLSTTNGDQTTSLMSLNWAPSSDLFKH